MVKSVTSISRMFSSLNRTMINHLLKLGSGDGNKGEKKKSFGELFFLIEN